MFYLTNAATAGSMEAVGVPEVEIPDVEETVSLFQKALPVILGYGKVLLICLLIFLIGRRLIKLIMKVIRRSFERSRMDAGASRFLTALASAVLNILLIVIVAQVLGVQTSSIVAIVGSAGLTLGLALQGSLSNLAGGVMILIRRPFIIGDYIITPQGEGNVHDIDIFYTRLRTLDNKTIVIPNGELSNSAITNATGCGERMLELVISVSYQSDIQKVKACLMEEISKQELVMADREKKVFVKELASHSIDIGVRMWVASDFYWELRWKLLEEIQARFRKEGIEIPFEQLDVHLAGAGDGMKNSRQPSEKVDS